MRGQEMPPEDPKYTSSELNIIKMQNMVNELLELLNSEKKNNEYFDVRYKRLSDDLVSMIQDIKDEKYPDDLNFIPMFHYVDRNVDDPEIYAKLVKINDWYINNYRRKDEVVVVREMIMAYLCDECAMSEKRAKSTIKGIAIHPKVYKEFAYYVANRQFKEPGLVVEGYSAKDLYEKYPLSIVGAYNYLVYLIEEPHNALEDLKAGLPRR